MPRSKATQEVTCAICGQRFSLDNVRPIELVSDPLLESIKQAHPQAELTGYICLDDLAKHRLQLVQNILTGEKGELEAAARAVLESLQDEESVLARDVYADYSHKLTVGERIADRVATFGGSWAFIISFGSVLFVWILINSLRMLMQPFDPFPYILLNLVLSCLAAIQAPVIMMSQNRKEAKDRLRSENDYRINLKAELEIRNLHNKLDLLISHQWQRLLEIQEIQTEMLEGLAAGNQHGNGTGKPHA
jgi:uncharacterized membrane protein